MLNTPQSKQLVEADTTTQEQTRILKCELKAWEGAFQNKHGRAPEKGDLALFPEIANKYRRYSKLKRVAGGRNSTETVAAAVHGGACSDIKDKAMFPLETSILSTPLKRKATFTCATSAVLPPQSPPMLQQPGASSCQPVFQPPSQYDSDADDTANATPKRQRTSMFFAATGVDSSVRGRAGQDGDCAQEGVDVDRWDTVAYVPPPSLIRRYNQQRTGTTATPARVQDPSPGTPHAAHSPLLSSFGVLSVSGQGLSEKSHGRATGASAMRALDLGIAVPSFKSRAGKLVKTTSIPLSIFGAQFRGASQILSSQGHLSDGGGDDDAGGTPASMRSGELNASELVVDEPGDGEQAAEAVVPSAHKKKATQKRSTRRVKLKPVGKDGSIATTGRPVHTDSPQLVSSNFYKLKLKSGRRGPQSADERRTALYKRMISKKSAGANSTPGAKAALSRGSLANDKGNGSLLAMESLYGRGEGAGEDSDNSASNCRDEGSGKHTTRKGRSATTRVGRCSPEPCNIAGRPLSFFSPDSGSSSSEVCSLDVPCPSSHDQAGAKEATVIDLRKVLSHAWGFHEFRPGQVCAIKRVLEARSTLLLLATGAGKSLVYQLPSLVLSSVHAGLTLVVTPLIALMRDQIRHLPSGLRALCMSFESAGKDGYDDAASRLLLGQVQLLFVSPERLQSPRFQALMAMEGMPPIQLAVVDEAHCASEWSHNFRPAYLQLPGLLQELGARCVLAMTGTATAALASRLCDMFGIDMREGTVRGDVVRNNIALSVINVELGSGHRSRSTAREDILLGILKTPEMAVLDSILVYVSTQASADRVAEYLTARSVPAQSYHAGKPAAERARIQAAFMRETLALGEVPIRVLVATVAFGLGLNKSDIRVVVHFDLPRSMEAYVQEVGRAGRDGAPAHGIMLLATNSTEGAALPDTLGRQQRPRSIDAVQIRSWAHADGVDATAVRRLLHRLFPATFVRSSIAAAARARVSQACPEPGDWRAVNTAVLELKALESDIDADQAVIQTLISYLALKDPAMFAIEPNAHRKCDIHFARTELGKLAEAHSFFAQLADYANAQSVLTAKQQQQRGGPSSRFQGAKKTSMCAAVDIFDLARSMGVPASDVTAELYQWRAKREVMLEWLEPSCVVKVLLDLGRFVAAPLDNCVDPSAEEWGEQLALRIDAYISGLAESICQQNEARIQDSLHKVNTVEALMLAALQLPRSHTASKPCADVEDPATVKQIQSTFLQTAIVAYFASSRAECKQTVSELKALTGGDSEDDEPYRVAIACLSNQFTGVDKPGSSEAISLEARAQIRLFAQKHCAELKTGRAIARIFHGLSSPSCSSAQWKWCSEWRSLVWTDFDAVRQCAQEELVRLHLPANNGLASS